MIYRGSLNFVEQGDILNMLGVGEHVDGLTFHEVIVWAHQSQITGLRRRITTDVHYFFWSDLQDRPATFSCIPFREDR